MNIPECMIIHELQHATSQDNHSKQLKEEIIWPENKDHIAQILRLYLTFQDDMAVINGVTLKGWNIVIPEKLQKNKH